MKRSTRIAIGVATLAALAIVLLSTWFNRAWWIKRIQARYMDTFGTDITEAPLSELMHVYRYGVGSQYRYQPRPYPAP